MDSSQNSEEPSPKRLKIEENSRDIPIEFPFVIDGEVVSHIAKMVLGQCDIKTLKT